MAFKVYLDNCCFNRPFDDQNQVRIRIETEAKLFIQMRVKANELELAWSYILDFENSVNPFYIRKLTIESWKKRAYVYVTENNIILEQANSFVNHNLRPKDALHIACAIDAGCDYFITTSDSLFIEFYQGESQTPCLFMQVM